MFLYSVQFFSSLYARSLSVFVLQLTSIKLYVLIHFHSFNLNACYLFAIWHEWRGFLLIIFISSGTFYDRSQNMTSR